jgi:hypothetical protein
MISIVDVIGDVVKKLNVHYEHGHPLEVVTALSKKSMDNSNFPAILLFQDFEEEVSSDRTVYAPLNIVICNYTKASYSASERYNNNFKPVLYPLLDKFIKGCANSKHIEGRVLPYKKTDRLYWGKSGLYNNTSNLFNEYVDAIEININLTFKNICNE